MSIVSPTTSSLPPSLVEPLLIPLVLMSLLLSIPLVSLVSLMWHTIPGDATPPPEGDTGAVSGGARVWRWG